MVEVSTSQVVQLEITITLHSVEPHHYSTGLLERKKERKFILHSDVNYIKLQADRLLFYRAHSSLEQSCYDEY